MKQYLSILALAALAACGQPSNETAAPAQAPATEQNQTAEAPEAQAPVQEKPAIKAHGYGIKDGMEYGYETAISDDDAKAGQVTNKVMNALLRRERRQIPSTCQRWWRHHGH